MASHHNRITDEYSDYNIARRVLGVGSVLGFGMLGGYAIMQTNNSAFIRGLARSFENPTFKPNTGSILASGTAINKSRLVRESIEWATSLGTSRERMTRDAMAAHYISKKDGFLDRVLAENERRIDESKARKGMSLTQNSIERKARSNWRPSLAVEFRRTVADMFPHTRTNVEREFLLNRRNLSLGIQTLMSEHQNELNDVITSIQKVSGVSLAPFKMTIRDNTSISGLRRMLRGLKSYMGRLDEKMSTKPGSRLVEIQQNIQNKLGRRLTDIMRGEIDPHEVETQVKNLKGDFKQWGNHAEHAAQIESVMRDKKISLQQKSTLPEYKEAAMFIERKKYGGYLEKFEDSFKRYKKLIPQIENALDEVGTSGKRIKKVPLRVAELFGLDATTGAGDVVIGNKSIGRLFVGDMEIRDILNEAYSIEDARRPLFDNARNVIEKARGLTTQEALTRNNFQALTSVTDDLERLLTGDVPPGEVVANLRKGSTVFQGIQFGNDLAHLADEVEVIQTRATQNTKAMAKALTGTGLLRGQTFGTAMDALNKNLELTFNEHSSFVANSVTQFVQSKSQDDFIEARRTIGAAIAEKTGKTGYGAKELKRLQVKQMEKYANRMFALSKAQKYRQIRIPTGFQQGLLDYTLHKINHDLDKKILAAGAIPDVNDLSFSFNAAEKNWETRLSDTLTEIKENAVKRANTIDNSNAKRLIETYKRISQISKKGSVTRSNITRAHALSISMGLGINPYEAFEETTAPFTRKVVRALKANWGAEDVQVGIRTLEQGSSVEFSFTPVRQGQKAKDAIKFSMPVTVGGIYTKGRNVIAAPGIATELSNIRISMVSHLKYVQDNILKKIENPKYMALRGSLETNHLNRMLQATADSVYGKGGKFELGQNITQMPFNQALQVSTYVQDIKGYRETSKSNIKRLQTLRSMKQEEYFRRSYSGSSKNMLRRLLKEIQLLDKRIKKTGISYERGEALFHRLENAQIYSMGGLEFSKTEANMLFGGLVVPNPEMQSADAAMRKRFSFYRNISEYGSLNMAGGTKQYGMTADIFDAQVRAFETGFNGYNMQEGLTFTDKHDISYFIDEMYGRKIKENPHYAMIQSRMSEFNERKRVIHKRMKAYRNKARNVSSKIVKKEKRLTNISGDSKSVKEVKESISHLRHKRGRFQRAANRFERLLKTYQVQYKEAAKLKQLIRRPSQFRLMEDVEREQIKNYVKKTFNIDMDFEIKQPQEHVHHSMLMSQNQLDDLYARGLAKMDEVTGTYTHVSPHQFEPTPLRMFLSDAPLLSEGVAFISEDAVNKLGKSVTSATSRSVTKSRIIDALEGLKARIPANRDIYSRAQKYITEIANLPAGTEINGTTIAKMFGKKNVKDIMVTLNDILNKGETQGKGLMQYRGMQDLIKQGKGTALFQSMVLDDKGNFNLRYKFVNDVYPKTKIFDEFSHKYVVASVLDKQSMDSMTRHAIIDHLKSNVQRYDLSNPTLTFLDKFDTKRYAGVSEEIWGDFLQTLKGSNNRSLYRAVTTMKTAEFIGAAKKLDTVAGRVSTALTNTVVNDILDIPGVKKLVANPEAKIVVEDIFDTILNSLSKKSDNPPDFGARRMRKKGRSNRIKSSILNVEQGKPRIGVNVDGQHDLTKLLLRVYDKEDHAQIRANVRTQVGTSLKSSLDKAEKSGLINKGESVKLRRAVLKTMNDFLVRHDPKAMPFQMLSLISNAFVTPQSTFDLNTITRRKYNPLKGFEKGAKISLYDAMMLKVQGMTRFSAKVMEHYKHGRQYMNSYMETLLKMMGMDPSKYIDGYSKSRSSKTRVGRMGADLSSDIMALKDVAMVYDPETEMRRFITKSPRGILDIDNNMNTEFLRKFRLTADEIASIDPGVAQQKLTQEMEEGLNELNKKITYDVKKEDFMKMADDDMVRLLRKSSQRLKVEEIEDYRKLLNRYKSLALVDSKQPNKPVLDLYLNSLKRKHVNVMELQRFGWNEEINNLVDMAKGRVRKTGDLRSMDKIVINGAFGPGESIRKTTDIIYLNDVLRDQLAFLRAVNIGAPESVIARLANGLQDSQLCHIRSTMQTMTNKAMPATVRGIGMAQSSIRLDRMNAWSMLQEIQGKMGNNKVVSGIFEGKNIFTLNNQDAKDALRTVLKSEVGADAKGVLKSFISAGTAYNPNVSQIAMSADQYRSALSKMVGVDKAKRITERVMSGQMAAMGMGIRYPTLRPLNTMPLAINLYEHNILEEIGETDLHHFVTQRGMAKDNIYINALDARLMGGDFDRDQFGVILALDKNFNDINQELGDTMVKQLKFNYEVETIDGKRAIIVKNSQDSKMGLKAQAIMDDVIESAEKGNIYIRGNGDYVVLGRGEQKIIENSLTVKNFVKYIKNNGRRSGEFVNEAIEEGRGTMTRVFVEAPTPEAMSELEKRLQDITKGNMSVLSMTDEELEAAAKHRRKSVDALLQDELHHTRKQMKSYARTLENLGVPRKQINKELMDIKMAFAKGSKMDFLMTNKYTARMGEMAAPVLGVKSLTGHIHNIGKYTVQNVVMATTKDPNKIITAQQLVGEYSQVNISSKHKIPVVASDIVESINTVLNPKAGGLDRAVAAHKLKTGEFKALLPATDIKDIFQTNKIINTYKNQNLNRAATQASQTISDLANKITDTRGMFNEARGITNKEWLSFQESKLSLAYNADDAVRQRLGLNSPDEISLLKRSIKGIETGIKKTKTGAGVFLESVQPFMEQMRINGVDNINKMTWYKTMVSNRDPSEWKIAMDLKKMVQGKTTLPLELQFNDIVIPRVNKNLRSKKMGSIFHGESAAATTSKRITGRIARMARRLDMDSIVDTNSLAGAGIGKLIGMAGIGFIGMFAIQSNSRNWLGPTSGTGGEYAERRTRKDEEDLERRDVINRLRNRDAAMPYFHMKRDKEAHLLPRGVKHQHGDSLQDRLKRLTSPNMIDEPMQFKI